MTRDAWLHAHPYLQPVADLHAIVERSAADITIPAAGVPRWDDYVDDFHDGVPLLSSGAAMNLAFPDDLVPALIDKLTAAPLPASVAEQCRARDEGLLRFLRWTVLVRYLRPLVAALCQMKIVAGCSR